MKLKYSFKTALSGLGTHKSRSALTILGIVIGITAIILIMSLGQGAQELILNQIRGMGSRTIVIEPGREPRGPSDFAEMFTDSLKEKDIQALKNPANVQDLAGISPLVTLTATVSFENETKRATIIGGSELIAEIFELYPSEGSFFTEDHIRQQAAVAVLGYQVREELFGLSDAVGQKVKIKGKSFRVLGVLPKKGRGSMYDIDNMATVPYSTAQHYLVGINYYHAIMAQAVSEETVERAADEIKLTLREQHNITDPDKDDFHITTQADAIERVGVIMSVLTAFLSAIAAISLIVGGIGIMNIMLVSVTERTREIGLRKALGATEKNILSQFLLEAIILTAVGGIVGILLGSAFAFLASLVLSKVVALGWVFTISWKAILLGLGVSGGIGLLFGLYPAYQASKKSPIEALRYE